MHLRIFGSFLAGATMGPALYLALGSVSLLLPVFVLIGLALVDWALGFGKAYTGQGMDGSGAQAGAGQPERPAAGRIRDLAGTFVARSGTRVLESVPHGRNSREVRVSRSRAERFPFRDCGEHF